MHILILSRSENVHVDEVEAYCKNHAIVDRIDFDTLSPDKLPPVTLGNLSTLKMPDAIFVHHPRIGYKAEWFADEIERKLFVASWDSVKEWMEAQFQSARWVNRPTANLKSKNVLNQLQLATSLSFQVPDTLFTNNASELRAFAKSDVVVIKQGNLGVHLEKKRILTSIVDVASLKENALKGCPCLFQRYVQKQFELRVHVIGDTVLACRIDSQESDKTRVDWRDYDLENTPHRPYELETDISKRCIRLVKQLGLEFGVIDLIVTPKNDLIFLECNAQGHWAWIEELTGLPITKTLCEHLLHGSAQ